MSSSLEPVGRPISDRTVVVGIDPGIDGALAVRLLNGHFQVTRMPTQKVILTGKTKAGKPKTRRVLDRLKIHDWLKSIRGYAVEQKAPVMLIIESQEATSISTGGGGEEGGMRQKGASGAMHSGQNWGILYGLSLGFGFAIAEVRPGIWRPKVVGARTSKEASRQLALTMYPELAPKLALKKDSDIAEALLILDYARLGCNIVRQCGRIYKLKFDAGRYYAAWERKSKCLKKKLAKSLFPVRKKNSKPPRKKSPKR